MTLSQFFAILRARWLAMLIVFAVVVLGTLAISFALPKKYTATAAILVDVKSPDPIAGMVFPGVTSPAYMSTQVDVIKSDRVAKRVVQLLNMSNNAAMTRQWRAETEGAGSFEAWMATVLQNSLDVKPSRESNVISVSYKSVDPKFSSALANAFAQAYIDTTLELRVEPAKQYSSFFDSRAQSLRDTLEKAQSKLSAFQKSNNIIATDERLDVENARLTELSTQMVLLQQLSADSSSRQAQATSNPEKLQDVMNNPVVAGLRTDITRQEARLQELGSRLGENHPQVRELRANLGELRNKLAVETSQVSGSVGVSDQINRSRESQLRSSLAEQRNKVLRMKAVRDEQNVLVRDVENAQKAYDQVMTRMSQTSLESHTTQTNVLLLNPANEPTSASSPRIQLNALLAVFVGTLLATGVALLLELMDRRVLTPQDVTQALDVPLIAVLPNRHPVRRWWWPLKKRKPTILQRRLMGRLPQPVQPAV
jgi:succinoglycan biosynthesis transport protein ExoP